MSYFNWQGNFTAYSLTNFNRGSTVCNNPVYKVPLPFKGQERGENKEHIRETAFEYSIYNEDFSEKTEISTYPINAVSTSDYDKYM